MEFKVEVPHVWYDIVGRITPGALLIVGLAWACAPHGLKRFLCYLSGSNTVSGVALTFALLGFIASAFVAGFLLAPLGKLLDKIFDCCRPLTLEEFSPVAAKLLKREFRVRKKECRSRKKRKWKARQSDKIRQAGSAALHSLWAQTTPPPIAALASKRDAEKLASGSFVWTSILVYGASLPVHRLECLAVRSFSFVCIVALSSLAYCHYRRRVVETPLDGLVEVRKQHEPTK